MCIFAQTKTNNLSMKQTSFFRNLLKYSVLGGGKTVTFHPRFLHWPLSGLTPHRFSSLLFVLALSGLAGLGLSGCEQVDWSDVQQEQALLDSLTRADSLRQDSLRQAGLTITISNPEWEVYKRLEF